MEEEIYYGEITNHHYLPQYVIMVDRGIRFRNVQRLKRYRFPLFSIVCLRNSRRKMVWILMEEEKYYGEITNHQYYTQQVYKPLFLQITNNYF